MITLFGGLLAITAVPTVGGRAAAIPLAIGAGAFVFGALVLYGAHLRRR